MHLPGHNFAAPEIKFYKRLNSDETPKERSKPINRVDNAAYNYDLCFQDMMILKLGIRFVI